MVTEVYASTNPDWAKLGYPIAFTPQTGIPWSMSIDTELTSWDGSRITIAHGRGESYPGEPGVILLDQGIVMQNLWPDFPEYRGVSFRAVLEDYQLVSFWGGVYADHEQYRLNLDYNHNNRTGWSQIFNNLCSLIRRGPTSLI
jgi:hypothetical protein